jgi:hypothetical protein
VKGNVWLNGSSLQQGDAAAVSDEHELVIEGTEAPGGELLLFDLK